MHCLMTRKFARTLVVNAAGFILLCPLLVRAARAEPPELPDRFGYGRAPDPAEIEQWDIDVKPDRGQLPVGRGTVAQGERIYTQKCLPCHGPAGKGGINDQLVDKYDPDNNFADAGETRKTIGNFWPYATTLYDYINRAMPMTAPGSLTADDVYGLTAYLLFLNDIVEQSVVLDANTLPMIEMPARKLFYWSDEALRLVEAQQIPD